MSVANTMPMIVSTFMGNKKKLQDVWTVTVFCSELKKKKALISFHSTQIRQYILILKQLKNENETITEAKWKNPSSIQFNQMKQNSLKFCFIKHLIDYYSD
jgi:hypothetical protein